MDGDGSAWVWSPNIADPDERIEMDLSTDVALCADVGLGAPPVPVVLRTGEGLTVFVDVDLGGRGWATVDGERCSETALCNLVARGWLLSLRRGMELLADAASADGAAEPGTAATD